MKGSGLGWDALTRTYGFYIGSLIYWSLLTLLMFKAFIITYCEERTMYIFGIDIPAMEIILVVMILAIILLSIITILLRLIFKELERMDKMSKEMIDNVKKS